jgi:hypothetical protein
MAHLRYCVAFVGSLMLIGCGSADRERAPPPVEETAFGDMVGTMDKARGVQDTVDAHKQDLDRQLESQEGQSER